jgi:hypothetical protein
MQWQTGRLEQNVEERMEQSQKKDSTNNTTQSQPAGPALAAEHAGAGSPHSGIRIPSCDWY